jgi:acetyl-CoA carboxylase carboxyl transferase subunit alpha
LVDDVLPEPLGGAHRNVGAMAETLKKALLDTLMRLDQYSIDELLAERYKRLLAYGRFSE